MKIISLFKEKSAHNSFYLHLIESKVGYMALKTTHISHLTEQEFFSSVRLRCCLSSEIEHHGLAKMYLYPRFRSDNLNENSIVKRLPADHELLIITEPTIFIDGRGTHILMHNFPLKTSVRLCFYSRIDLFLK